MRKQLSETNTFDDSDNIRHKSAERFRFENVKNNLRLVLVSLNLNTVNHAVYTWNHVINHFSLTGMASNKWQNWEPIQ